MKRNVSVVRLIVATRSSDPPACLLLKETPGSVASGTPYINVLIGPASVIYNPEDGSRKLLRKKNVFIKQEKLRIIKYRNVDIHRYDIFKYHKIQYSCFIFHPKLLEH
jgi:hypothetical protein